MEKNPYLGKFIVFEGLDGSGQSTQAALLKDFLVQSGHGVILTKEPTMDSGAGRQIRQVLNKNTGVQPLYLQELFAEDRREHLANVIAPALKDGKIAISDRYFFSSFAYGAASGVDLEELIKLNQGFLTPDLTIILKVRPEVCMERIGKRGEPQTLFEEAERLGMVWQTYQALPERFENVYIINGERQIKEVFSEVKEIVRSKLNL
ncbi:MAG: dTMP kinase [Candidatus Nealsonbacteria bacterium]|nr:dTMP kinase [Candidatus Nealsonbacteria bacterium]